MPEVWLCSCKHTWLHSKGYGHSMIFFAYFLITLSSPKMKRDLLTVKQFSRTGIGLYRAMVRARWALVCLKAGEMPPVDTAAPSRFRLRSDRSSISWAQQARHVVSKPGHSARHKAHGEERQRREKSQSRLKAPGAGRGAALDVTNDSHATFSPFGALRQDTLVKLQSYLKHVGLCLH